MADIGLHRPDSAAGSTEGIRQRRKLDRVPHGRPGAMRLDQTDAGRVDPGAPIEVGDQRGLSRPVRRRDTIGAAILFHRRTEDDAAQRVTISQRIGQPLQNDHTDPIGRHDAIGLGGKRPAGTARREQSGIGKKAVALRVGHGDGHAPGQRQLAFAKPQGLGREMQCRQGGGASGIDRQRRAPKIQRIGDPRGKHSEGAADSSVAAVILPRVVAGLRTGEYPDLPPL
jgi:hypothetical protein